MGTSDLWLPSAQWQETILGDRNAQASPKLGLSLSATAQVGVAGESALLISLRLIPGASGGSVATPTPLALRNRRAARTCFVIVFEGVGIALTTSEDLAGIQAAWAGTPWASDKASWLPAAFIPGPWSQQLEFFNPKIRADSISFRVLDRRDYLAGLLFGANAQTHRTFLASDLPNDDTVIGTEETAAFPSVGDYYLYIGNETIKVDGTLKTDAGWIGQRAQWALHQTQIGTDFAPAHRLNTINGNRPRITDRPTSWVNRKVAIYLHHYEAGLALWSSRDQALLVWEGLLRNPADNGDRTLTFTAVRVTDLLNRYLFEDQFQAEVAQGLDFAEGENKITVRANDAGAAAEAWSFTFTPGRYAARDLVQLISANMPPSLSGLVSSWSLMFGPEGKLIWSARIVLSAPVSTFPNLRNYEVGMSDKAWRLLGFDPTGANWVNEQAGSVFPTMGYLGMSYDHTNGTVALYQRTAENTPIKYDFSHVDPRAGIKQVIALANVQGSFDVQPVLPADAVPAGTEGYLQIANMAIVGGIYDSGAATFTITHVPPSTRFGDLGFSGAGGVTNKEASIIREDQVQGTLVAKQVWYEQDAISRVLLRLLLSTGTANYNDPTYDVNPAGMGAGIPWSLLDVPAFEALGTDLWTLALTEPTELGRLVESALATYNRYLVWRQGKLTVVEPKVDGPTIATAFRLTNDNKANKDDRARAELAADGILNRVELKYDRDLGGTFRSTEVFDDAVSQTDFGMQRAISIEAWGIEDYSGQGLPDIGNRIAGKVLAYFSRPLTVVERTITKQFIELCPGDTVLLSDPYLINPKTGARGLVDWPAWVMSVSFDPKTMTGKAKLAYSPEFPTDKICPWAASARVNQAATNGGYVVVDGTQRYLDVEPAHYQASGGTGTDDTFFAAGHKIIIRELSPADPYTPLIWHAEVASVDTAAHRIYLTATLAGWDSARRYVVTPDLIATVVVAQRANTFIADDATDSTGLNPNDSYVWGTPSVASPRVLAPQGFVVPPLDGSVDAAGAPLAAADVFEAIASVGTLLSHKTRHMAVCSIWADDFTAQSTGGDKRLVFGPQWVPLYAHGERSLLVRIYGRTDGDPATFTITAAKSMPQGETDVDVVWVDQQKSQVTRSTSSTTKEWMDEIALPCYPDTGIEPPGIWFAVEAHCANPSTTVILNGVIAFEAAA